MSYDPSRFVTIQNLKDSVARVKSEYLSAISKSGHASFRKADAVPTAATAEENILYLVPNAETGNYDVYALVEGSVEWLDDMKVNLDGYVNTSDVKRILKHALGTAVLTGDALTAADFDGDGQATTNDARALLKSLVSA